MESRIKFSKQCKLEGKLGQFGTRMHCTVLNQCTGLLPSNGVDHQFGRAPRQSVQTAENRTVAQPDHAQRPFGRSDPVGRVAQPNSDGRKCLQQNSLQVALSRSASQAQFGRDETVGSTVHDTSRTVGCLRSEKLRNLKKLFCRSPLFGYVIYKFDPD